jgi:hypothetical protein
MRSQSGLKQVCPRVDSQLMGAALIMSSPASTLLSISTGAVRSSSTFSFDVCIDVPAGSRGRTLFKLS